MFNGSILNQLMEDANVKKVDVYNAIHISRASLNNIISGSQVPNCAILERLADYFSVSMDVFFIRDLNYKPCQTQLGHSITGNGNTITSNYNELENEREIQHLKELLEEKERLIQVLLNKQCITEKS